ncbi:hypothetical protein F5882DRAFT_383191 [Hyaloscypha sp. PMI_1271]|nr:hypothetical protein F5882DRAFT_383191 [Hyaloscypha sp. PMI_1271]
MKRPVTVSAWNYGGHRHNWRAATKKLDFAHTTIGSSNSHRQPPQPPATPSPLKARPTAQGVELTGHNHKALRDLSRKKLPRATTTDSKKELIIWETTKFALDIAVQNGLPLPIIDPAVADANTGAGNHENPLNKARRQRGVEDDFVDNDAPASNDEAAHRELRRLVTKAPPPPAEVPEQAQVTALTVIPFGFGTYHVATIVQQRAAFVQELVASRIQIQKDLKQEIRGFTLEEAHRMANSIYHELLGLPAVKHVATIIKEYISVNEAGIDSSAGARAKKLASDPSVPEVLRAACNIFAEQQQLDLLGSHNTKPKLTALHHTVTDLVLHRRINALSNPSSNGRRAVLSYLLEHGYLARTVPTDNRSGLRLRDLEEVAAVVNGKFSPQYTNFQESIGGSAYFPQYTAFQ